MRLGLLGALFLVAAACGQAAPSDSPSSPPVPVGSGPTRICDPFQDADPPPVSCTEVIGKVLLEMGPDAAAVKAAWFRPGSPCPPNARCMAPPPGSAYVVVRLESGATGISLVTFAGPEIAVETVVTPTFEVWPPSGEMIPQVGRPEIGPGLPAEIADRLPLPLCWDEDAGTFDSPLARRCFLGAVQDGRPAELHVRSADEAGPVKELYRFAGRGPVLVYQSRPKPADPGWVRKDCAIGPAFDDATIFIIQECLSTELP